MGYFFRQILHMGGAWDHRGSWKWTDHAASTTVTKINIDEFATRMQLTRIDLDTLLSSSDISDKRRVRLMDLKAQFASGDNVLHYCSDREEWGAGMGSEGYVLVRDNEIIENLVLRMN